MKPHVTNFSIGHQTVMSLILGLGSGEAAATAAIATLVAILMVAGLQYYCCNSLPRPSVEFPTLVGVVGRAGHGKDSIGNVLEVGHGFERDAFARPLKDAARVLWRFTEQQLYGALKERTDPRWGVSPREVLQFLGTEVGREMFPKLMPQIGERFWLEHFKLRFEDLTSRQPSARVVVCDVRFPNEAQFIRSLGGVIVKVIRPDHNAFQASTAEASKSTHKSETLMDEILADVVVVNDGSLEDLTRKVEQDIVPLIRQLHKRRLNNERSRKDS